MAPLTSTVTLRAKLKTRSMSCSISRTVTSAGSASMVSRICWRSPSGTPGHRFVEQQHARHAGDRQGDLEQAPLAVGQQRHLLVHHVVEVELGQQPVATLGNAGDRCPPPSGCHQPALWPSRPLAASASDCTGVSPPNSWLIWKVRTSPRSTRRCAASRVMSSAFEQDGAGARRQHAGQQVDQRGLAGAVGADQGMARAA